MRGNLQRVGVGGHRAGAAAVSVVRRQAPLHRLFRATQRLARVRPSHCRRRPADAPGRQRGGQGLRRRCAAAATCQPRGKGQRCRRWKVWRGCCCSSTLRIVLSAANSTYVAQTLLCGWWLATDGGRQERKRDQRAVVKACSTRAADDVRRHTCRSPHWREAVVGRQHGSLRLLPVGLLRHGKGPTVSACHVRST